LTSAERLAVSRGVAQFNKGLYFECHETLEDLWRGLLGPSRDFFQALIQVSVGFHHLERGNRVGALRTFAKALSRLEAYPARYLGFDVAAQQDWLREIPAGPPPIWRFDENVEEPA
jgi:predicted metal-dependent hydrolase